MGSMTQNFPPQAAQRLVAVVVTCNRLAQLKTTLQALFSVTPADLAGIVVFDNASEDGTPEWLASVDDTRLTVLRSEVNSGGAGGFEKGMRYAVETLNPDWLVLMDDDARPKAGALERFHQIDLTNIDGLAAAVYHPNGDICEMNRPTLNPFARWSVMRKTLAGGGRDAYHLCPDDFARDGLQDIDGASFVGFFVRAETVVQRGYPDPNLFLYGDDASYTMGLSKAGHRLAFDRSVVFEHDSSTYSLADPRIRPAWKIYYYYRNLLILYREITGWAFPPIAVLYIAKWRRNARHYGPDREQFLRIFWIAVRDGLRQKTSRSHTDVLALARDDQTNA